VADIAAAADGSRCPNCGAAMRSTDGIEVGNIFKLGTRYSAALGATYLDADGKSHPIQMGSYGIGSGRLAATIVEQRYDEKGIVWPFSVAPYHVSLLALASASDDGTITAAERLYDDLVSAGVEVLYDDRVEQRAGVKFTDAELIGNPIRLSVSPRSLEAGHAEIRLRTSEESTFVELDDAVSTVLLLLDEMRQASIVE
jgi:prolyl-tRNA synthetase